MEFLTGATLEQVGIVGIICTIGVLALTEKLRWGPKVDKEKAKIEERAERWEKTGTEALFLAARAGLTMTDTVVPVISNLPNPEGDRESNQAGEV